MEKNKFMLHAIALAEKGRKNTAPNPCVGAVLVQNNIVVAEGYHEFFGKEHAEIACLEDACKKNINPADCELYVSLEPCNHFGKTPPCTHAIIDAHIKKVYIGTKDTTKHASGGMKYLEENNIECVCGIEEEKARNLIADFLYWQNTQLPYITIKLASTLDGYIAGGLKKQEMLSCEKSLIDVQNLRSKTDAILIGGNTFRTDNPALTCRLDGYSGTQPKALILTKNLPTAHTAKILTERAQDVFFLTTEEQAKTNTANALKNMGCHIIAIKEENGILQLTDALKTLYKEHAIYRILCEGGGMLAETLLAQNLAKELIYYICPKIFAGEKGVKSFYGAKHESLNDSYTLELMDTKILDNDIQLHYKICQAKHT